MKPTRRWFQYSLRSFLILLTVFAVWLGVAVNRAREQREAVEAIEALGGIVQYDWQPSVKLWRDDSAPLSNRKLLAHEWLSHLAGDDYFQKVEGVMVPFYFFFQNDEMNDFRDKDMNAAYVRSMAAHLRQLPYLKTVYLNGGQYVLNEIRDQFRELSCLIAKCIPRNGHRFSPPLEIFPTQRFTQA